jgi:polyhydroxyalkanoate synthase
LQDLERNQGRFNVKTTDEWLGGAERREGSWWVDWDQWVAQFAGKSVPARHPGDGALTPIEDAPGSYVKARL